MKILMVCLGNICRSPMAEGIMRHKIQQLNLNASVDSCGTADYHVGDSPDMRAQQILKTKGIDISNLIGRQFTLNDFENFDLILTMDKNNYDHVMYLARNENDKNKVDMIMNKLYPNEDIAVQDPYYGGQQGFEDTYNMLDLACKKIADELSNFN